MSTYSAVALVGEALAAKLALPNLSGDKVKAHTCLDGAILILENPSADDKTLN